MKLSSSCYKIILPIIIFHPLFASMCLAQTDRPENEWERTYRIWAAARSIPALCEKIYPFAFIPYDPFVNIFGGDGYSMSDCYKRVAIRSGNRTYCDKTKDRRRFSLITSTRNQRKECLVRVAEARTFGFSNDINVSQESLLAMGYRPEFYPLRPGPGLYDELQLFVQFAKDPSDFNFRALTFLPDFSQGDPKDFEALQQRAIAYDIDYLKGAINEEWLSRGIGAGNLTFLKNAHVIGIPLHNYPSLLHTALRTENIEIVNYLLSIGFDINTTSTSGKSAIELAYELKNDDLIRLLLNFGASTPSSTMFSLTTWDQLQRIDETLASGYDINATDDDGHTLLYHLINRYDRRSSSKDDLEKMVRFLLSKGFDPSLNAAQTVKLLAQRGEYDAIRLLVDNGLNLKNVVIQRTGETPLHNVVSIRDRRVNEADLDIVRYLISNGISIDARDSAGNSPLIYSARNSYDNSELMTQLLLERGAKINLKNDKGETALHAAAASGSLTIFKLLLESGADPSLKSNAHLTPIMQLSKPVHEVIKTGNIPGLRFLLAQGLKPNREGFLIVAIEHRCIECLRLLLKNGADASKSFQRGSFHSSAIVWAKRRAKEANNTSSYHRKNYHDKQRSRFFKNNPAHQKIALDEIEKATQEESKLEEILQLLEGSLNSMPS